jgi:hypothetical protein
VLIDKTTTIPGGVYDRRPCAVEGFVKGSTSGFYFDAATNIILRNCSVQWGENKQSYFAEAIEQHNTEGLKLISFTGKAAVKK